MDDEPLSEKPDMTLSYLAKQDLYTLSVGDLEDRIDALKAEVTRCEEELKGRGDTRSEAEKLFKF